MINRKLLGFIGVAFSIGFLCSAQAEVFQVPLNGDTVVGQEQKVTVKSGDNLHKIARRYDVGYGELVLANPLITPDKIYPGQKINIPSLYILPQAQSAPELIINLAERRMYYYINADQVFTAPIAIGRRGWETPIATAFVDRKVTDPHWKVPQAIRDHNREQGKHTPEVIPAGPHNPLGSHAITLTLPDYIIHGTNDPTTIGKRISAGCIRMYPEDIAYLFKKIPTGTRVSIINQPIKMGRIANQYFLEIHNNSSEQEILSQVISQYPGLANHQTKVLNIIEQGRGIPQPI